MDPTTGDICVRGFVQYIMKPIHSMFDSVMNNEKEKYEKLLTKLDIKFPADAKELTGKPLLKRLMQSWIPVGDTLLQMIITHLPSPARAQRYRAETLYNGPLDDEAAVAVRRCDPSGPLMMFVSKMVRAMAGRVSFVILLKTIVQAADPMMCVPVICPIVIPFGLIAGAHG